jgi:hypothetical protein
MCGESGWRMGRHARQSSWEAGRNQTLGQSGCKAPDSQADMKQTLAGGRLIVCDFAEPEPAWTGKLFEVDRLCLVGRWSPVVIAGVFSTAAASVACGLGIHPSIVAARTRVPSRRACSFFHFGCRDRCPYQLTSSIPTDHLSSCFCSPGYYSSINTRRTLERRVVVQPLVPTRIGALSSSPHAFPRFRHFLKPPAFQ